MLCPVVVWYKESVWGCSLNGWGPAFQNAMDNLRECGVEIHDDLRMERTEEEVVKIVDEMGWENALWEGYIDRALHIYRRLDGAVIDALLD